MKRDPLETECTEDRSSVALCNLVSLSICSSGKYYIFAGQIFGGWSLVVFFGKKYFHLLHCAFPGPPRAQPATTFSELWHDPTCEFLHSIIIPHVSHCCLHYIIIQHVSWMSCWWISWQFIVFRHVWRAKRVGDPPFLKCLRRRMCEWGRSPNFLKVHCNVGTTPEFH